MRIPPDGKLREVGDGLVSFDFPEPTTGKKPHGCDDLQINDCGRMLVEISGEPCPVLLPRRILVDQCRDQHGGVDHDQLLASRSSRINCAASAPVIRPPLREAIRAEAEDAIAQTGGRKFILANGCSVPDDTDPQWLNAAREIVEELVGSG